MVTAEATVLPPSEAQATGLMPALEQFITYCRDYRALSQKTIEAYRADCQAFVRSLSEQGVRAAEQVERRHAIIYATRLNGLAPATVRRRIASVSSWFRYLSQVGIVQCSPVAGIELPKRRHYLPQIPTPQQCEALLAACSTPRERLVIGLMLSAGLRKAEVLGLDVADVGASLEQARVRGKGRRERQLPLCQSLQGVLREYLATRASPSPALVLGREGKRMGTTSLYRLFRRVLRRAGLADARITPHTLRHTFATTLAHAGVDVSTLAELLGHSNISVTSIYLHANADTKRSAVDRLPWALPCPSQLTDVLPGGVQDEA